MNRNFDNANPPLGVVADELRDYGPVWAMSEIVRPKFGASARTRLRPPPVAMGGLVPQMRCLRAHLEPQ